MINSWFTLQKCANVFDTLYRGSVLERCITFRKNELWLIFRDRKALLIHLGSPFQYCLNVQEPPSSRRESVRIFPSAEGSIVESVSILAQERVIRFSMSRDAALYLVFLSNRGNVVYVQEERAELFKKRIPIDEELLRDIPEKSYSSLEEDPRFSPYWKRNISALLGSNDYSDILEILQNSVGEEKMGRFLLLPNENPFDAHIFYANYRKYISTFLQDSRFREEYKTLERRLSTQMDSLQRQISGIPKEDKLQKDAEKYRYFADTLAACRHQIKFGKDAFEIPEALRNDDQPALIPLKAERSIAQNIDHFYALARSAEKRIDTERRREQNLRVEYSKSEALYQSLKKLSSYQELLDWKKAHGKALSAAVSALEPGEKRPYREFIFEGWRIWVGKSAKDNEELTFRYAAKTDLWLHVRHGAGSHVILKREGRKQPPKKILMYAAALAARFSEQKHSKLVSVVCAERKHVSKIKGGSAGQVRYRFEENILTEAADIKS